MAKAVGRRLAAAAVAFAVLTGLIVGLSAWMSAGGGR